MSDCTHNIENWAPDCPKRVFLFTKSKLTRKNHITFHDEDMISTVEKFHSNPDNRKYVHPDILGFGPDKIVEDRS